MTGIMIYFAVILVVLLASGYVAHYFRTAINSSLMIAREKNILKRALQFDKEFINGAGRYLSKVEQAIISWLCPLLLMSIVLTCADAIIMYKGQSFQELHIAVSILSATSVVCIYNLLRVFNTANCFSGYMIIAYYIEEVIDVVDLWEQFITNTEQQDFSKDENIKRLEMILQRHSYCVRRLLEFYPAVDNEKIRTLIKQHTKPLFKVE